MNDPAHDPAQQQMDRERRFVDCITSTWNSLAKALRRGDQQAGAQMNDISDTLNEMGYSCIHSRDPGGDDQWARQQGYAVGSERGLHLKDDGCVRYYRSTFRDKPCYYIDWSSYQYVWVNCSFGSIVRPGQTIGRS